MSATEYSLGFTTGAALIQETVLVAKLFAEHREWGKVREIVLTKNSLQTRTLSSSKKLYGEVSRRLKRLNDDQLNLIENGSGSQVKALVWLGICRQYKLIRDFAIEVIIQQYEASRMQLTHDDYNSFFNNKAEWHENLDRSSRQTKAKARQVVFKMMIECGLLNDDREIQPFILDEKLAQVIATNRPDDLRLFPGMS